MKEVDIENIKNPKKAKNYSIEGNFFKEEVDMFKAVVYLVFLENNYIKEENKENKNLGKILVKIEIYEHKVFILIKNDEKEKVVNIIELQKDIGQIKKEVVNFKENFLEVVIFIKILEIVV